MRLRAYLRSRELDRALATGVSPDSSGAISLRAHTLVGAATRSALARSVRRLIEDAQQPLSRLTPVVPICRRKILSSRKTLEELADRLASGDPVDARGVAKARLLLSDGAGPVYNQPAADDLEPALHEVLRTLQLAL